MQNAYITKRNIMRILAASTAATLFVKFFVTFNNNGQSRTLANELGQSSKNDKLVSVQMVTRHGARTPLHLIPGIEEATYLPELLKPYVLANVNLKSLNKSMINSEVSYYDELNLKKILKGGASAGMLTVVGEKQMYELGRRLKAKYIDQLGFLSPAYNPDEIYTRSTHFLRTIRSAKSVLAGMFTREPTETAEFFIHVNRNEDDWTYPNALNCQLFSHIMRYSGRLLVTEDPDPPTEFMKHLDELHNHFNHKGEARNLSYTIFRDDIVARQVHGLHVPKDILDKGLLEKTDRLAGQEMLSVFEHDTRLACGLFVHLIVNNLNRAIKRDQQHPEKEHEHKFIYFSAHDSTIGALLVALNKGNVNKMEYDWPPFAANLIIELWKSEDENKAKPPHYYIKVLYLHEPLLLSQCKDETSNDKTRCDLNKFKSLLELTRVDEKEYNRLCSQSPSHPFDR